MLFFNHLKQVEFSFSLIYLKNNNNNANYKNRMLITLCTIFLWIKCFKTKAHYLHCIVVLATNIIYLCQACKWYGGKDLCDKMLHACYIYIGSSHYQYYFLFVFLCFLKLTVRQMLIRAGAFHCFEKGL